ncbi:MAG: hypothetical protein RIR91_219 [Verrucomicrobiota bacterium]|jgi:hypothetical protein
MSNTKAEIVAAFKKAAVRQVEVAGVAIHLRGLTGSDRVAFNQAIEESKKTGEPVPDYLVAFWGMCDSEGARLFATPEECADFDGNTLQTIALEVLKASGLYSGNDAKGEVSSADEAQKN